MGFFRSNIEAMDGYTPGEQPQHGKFIKLNTNENPYPPSREVTRAIQAVLEQGLGRYPDSMATAFRLRAADILQVSPDCILCGNGSDDLLTIITRALVGEGERLRLPYPSYVLYKTLANIQGAETEEIGFQSDWTLPPQFADASPGLKLAFLPNPNSPTGTLVSPTQVAAMAERMPCPLVADEAYVDFAEQSCLGLVARHDNVIVLRTMSKSYSLAGLRFGYLVAQPSLIAQFLKVKDSYNCDALSIAGATAAINDQTWLAETTVKIKATRTRLTRELAALGFDVIDSQANFVWAEHSRRSPRELYEELKASRVLVRYMKYARWREGLRISIGTDQQIDALLTLLKTMV